MVRMKESIITINGSIELGWMTPKLSSFLADQMNAQEYLGKRKCKDYITYDPYE